MDFLVGENHHLLIFCHFAGADLEPWRVETIRLGGDHDEIELIGAEGDRSHLINFMGGAIDFNRVRSVAETSISPAPGSNRRWCDRPKTLPACRHQAIVLAQLGGVRGKNIFRAIVLKIWIEEIASS
jgi:hypothetical protein